MQDEQLDCVVAAGSLAVNHLVRYWRYFGGPAAAVISADGTRALLVGHDEGESAEELGLADSVHTYGTRGFGLVPDPAPQIAHAISALPQLNAATQVGVASEIPTLTQQLRALCDPPFVNAHQALERIRLVKDEDELELIAHSYQLAWRAQRAVEEHARPGASEIELFTAAQSAAQLAAAEPIEFLGDLLCGARTAGVCAPIRVASSATLASSDAVVSDLVVGCEGYWGDTAETLIVGDWTEVSDVRTELRGVLDACSALLTPGRPSREVFEAMSERIAHSFPGGEFPHHGGHGIGLGFYDDPHVIPTDEMTLEAGMVLALEPGVYFPDRFGARVEQMYVVREGGGLELRSAVDRQRNAGKET
jgi:Xaa-Pro aminopeptidase